MKYTKGWLKENTGFKGEFDENGFQIMRSAPRTDNALGWQFYCASCKRIHYHGVGLGHRAVHHTAESGLMQGGYVIEPAKGVTMDELKENCFGQEWKRADVKRDCRLFSNKQCSKRSCAFHVVCFGSPHDGEVSTAEWYELARQFLDDDSFPEIDYDI